MDGDVMASGMQHSTFYGYDNVFPLRDPMWSDLQIPVNALKLSGVKPPEWTSYKGGQILAFGDEAVEGNEEIVYFDTQLPSSYLEGSGIECHIHWLGEDNTAGNVAWTLTYSWVNVGEAFPGETTITTLAPNGETDILLEVDLADIDGTDKKIQSMLICSLKRNSSNVADTLTGKSAYIMEVDFHIQINTPGSENQNTKYN